MATSEILGLFQSPEQYQANQLAQFRQRAANEVQLNPFQQAAIGMRQAGYQLGGGIGGALGGEDPQLKMISQRQALSNQLDPSDPASYMKVAQVAAQIGDQQFAIAIANAGREAAVKVAQANKERQMSVAPDIQKAQQAASIAQAIEKYKEMPQTPEIQRTINTLQLQLDFLAPKAEKVPDALQVAKRVADIKAQLSPDAGVILPPNVRAGLEAELRNLEKQEKSNIIDVGVAEKTREVVYFDKDADQQFVMKPSPTDPTKLVRSPYSGGIDKTTAKVSASSTSQQESEFSKDLGKADAERVKNAMATRENAIGTLTSLNRLNELNQQDLISGTFASGRVGATNLISTLGLASGKDIDRLSASENYQKTAGDVILATLGGKLGAGFSNEDRKFIQSLVPQLENSPQARKQLVEFMVKKNNSIVEETTRLENYARDNKSLKGYVPKIPVINLGGGVNKPVSQMTRQELLDEKARLLGNKKP
jgi:hypothetical protein